MTNREVLEFLQGVALDVNGAEYYESLNTGISIREGCYYKRTDGSIVGPAMLGSGWAPWFVGDSFYHGNGVCPVFGSEVKDWRLVAEVKGSSS